MMDALTRTKEYLANQAADGTQRTMHADHPEVLLAELVADNQRLRKIMRDWYEEELRDDRDNRRNAPGHCHDVPGIWDSDNGSRAGKPCKRCALWFEARKEQAGEP